MRRSTIAKMSGMLILPCLGGCSGDDNREVVADRETLAAMTRMANEETSFVVETPLDANQGNQIGGNFAVEVQP